MNILKSLYKKSLQFFLLTVIFSFAALPVNAQNAETEKPLKLEEILDSLRASKTGLPTTNRILIQKVKTRGINFTFDGEVEKSLTATGANDDLISEIKYKIVEIYFEDALKCGRKDYECQINIYNKAIELLSDDSVAYYNRAIVYDEKGDYDQAVKDYTKAISLDPKYFNAYHNRGITYRKKGDYDRSIADFNSAIKLDPKDASAFWGRALSFRLKGDLQSAFKDITNALKLDPKDADNYFERGNIYFDQKKL